MTKPTITDDLLQAAIISALGLDAAPAAADPRPKAASASSDPPDADSRLETMRQQMREEWKEDEDPDLNREWAQENLKRIDAWLSHLTDLEQTYQARVAKFLDGCLKSSATVQVPELREESALERLSRVWGSLNDQFESAMPDNLAALDQADFIVDTQSACAWWDSETAGPAMDLYAAAMHCLTRAGEFSEESARVLAFPIIRALCVGTAPLPSFRLRWGRPDRAVWQWFSPEADVNADLSRELLDSMRERERFANAAPREANGISRLASFPLSEATATEVSEIIGKASQAARNFGLSEWSFVQILVNSLCASTMNAATIKDAAQLRLAFNVFRNAEPCFHSLHELSEAS